MESPATFVLKSHWKEPEILEALAWYAKTYRMIVFTRVPVTGPAFDAWGPECPELLEIIAVPAAVREAGTVREFDREAFEAVLITGSPAHPVLAIGYADRPCFGYWQPARRLLLGPGTRAAPSCQSP